VIYAPIVRGDGLVLVSCMITVQVQCKVCGATAERREFRPRGSTLTVGAPNGWCWLSIGGEEHLLCPKHAHVIEYPDGRIVLGGEIHDTPSSA